MYLRRTTRKKDGKVHRYWSLVRSVRLGRRVIQQTVAHLGELDERGRIEARALARHLIGVPEEARLFDDGCRDVAVPVRLKGVRVERSRQFGDVYLADFGDLIHQRRGRTFDRRLRHLPQLFRCQTEIAGECVVAGISSCRNTARARIDREVISCEHLAGA